MADSTIFEISYEGNILPSVTHSHDTNPIHTSTAHARVAYFSMTRSGEIASLDERLPPFVITPGALITSLNETIFPGRLNYLKSGFKAPLLIVPGQTTDLSLRHEEKKAGIKISYRGKCLEDDTEIDLGRSTMGFAEDGFDFQEDFGDKFRVTQEKDLAETGLYDGVDHKGRMYKGAYLLGDKEIPFSRSYLLRVSKEDHLNYVISIGAEDRADDQYASPLEIMVKLPRHQLLFMQELMQRPAYAGLLDSTFKGDSRREAAKKYVEKHNIQARQKVDDIVKKKREDDILTVPNIIFLTSECYYNPTVSIPIGKEFQLLYHFSPFSSKERHRFIVEGFLEGSRFLYSNMRIHVDPLLTEDIITYRTDKLKKGERAVPLHVLSKRPVIKHKPIAA